MHLPSITCTKSRTHPPVKLTFLVSGSILMVDKFSEETGRLFLVSEMAHKLSMTNAPGPKKICKQTSGFGVFIELVGDKSRHRETQRQKLCQGDHETLN